MSSFVEIYKVNCIKRGEEPLTTYLYEELDRIWNWIQGHDFKELYLESLSESRVCILSAAPKFFYDTISNGVKLYYFNSGTDRYRIEIINRLSGEEPTPLQLEYFGDKAQFVLWKLTRLEKRYRLGTWEKYAESYK